ncbi:MAG TPA: methionine synthase [Dehalococcoidia bacterium]|nr:methionine synthase [Dehalococcoidia bacterium]
MKPDILQVLRERVVIFDGAMGTAIQGCDLGDDDFWGKDGCNELITLSRPDVLREIHAGYLAAGADVIETNSFGGTPLVLAEYELADRAYELNKAAAEMACTLAAEFSTPDRPRWVSGAMGPGTKLPTLGHVSYDAVLDAYMTQAQGLLDGGVDLLQIETCYDPLQAKAALAGALRAMERSKRRVPLIVQVTMELTGSMLVGTEIGAALAALDPFPIDVIGINCATGPAEMSEHIRYLSQHSRRPISVLPNAGLPIVNAAGAVYPLTPDELVRYQRIFVQEFGVSIVGGCCGTTNAHVKALADALWGHAPVARSPQFEPSVASLYTPVTLQQETSFLVVGERLNANGSRQYRQLLLADDYDAMQGMIKQQVREGAHLLDVCVDYVGRDGTKDMDAVAFRFGTQSTLPLMIDSTEAAVIETALKRLGGRAVINSINLEDGEARMDRVMPLSRQHGAAVVALCIDEEGQARTADWKLRVAHRIHDLAIEKWGMRPQDLIFDTLTMPIATGQEEVRRDGIETIEAIRRVKAELPGCYTILGVSNISFGLKPAARQVLNSVFLHYAVEAGLDAAIVNPQKILPLHRIDPAQREAARRLVFDERTEGFDPLTAFIELFVGDEAPRERGAESGLPVEERLKRRIIDGERKGIERDLDEALATPRPTGARPENGDKRRRQPAPRPYQALEIINEILLDGMRVVGELFASGEMQLPFVLQSAEAMKSAVAYLEPMLEQTGAAGRGTIVLGTVKGDVHDIGKNLVDIILSNNGYTVHNIGIKQPLQAFVEKAEETRADALGMSGLLVKSTVIMKENLLELNERGLSKYPVLLGGAALTRGYVENDLRGLYKGQVFYGQDAFEGLRTMDAIVRGEGHVLAQRGGKKAQAAEAQQLEDYQKVEDQSDERERRLEEAKRFVAPSSVGWTNPVPRAPFFGVRVARGIGLHEVYAHINEIALFRSQWRYTNSRGLPKGEYEAWLDAEVRPVYREWQNRCIEEQLLAPQVVYGYWPCQSQGNDLILYAEDGRTELARFTFPRQLGGKQLCLADYFRPVNSGELDVVALHAVTMGPRATEREHELFAAREYRDYLHLHGISVEATEALAELWHKRIREELGIACNDAADVRGLFRKEYQGARYSFGYPACPEREHDAVLARLLGPERIGAALTDEYMWEPEQTTSAIVVHHPDAHYFNVV